MNPVTQLDRSITLDLVNPVTGAGADLPATVPPCPQPDGPPSLSVRAFLDDVGRLLRGGLPPRVWIEATVVAVKASTYGHSLELVDPKPDPRQPAQLRTFLPSAARMAIQAQLGLANLDPNLLVGMTTTVLIEPQFGPRWHLGGRVVGLTQSARDSMRRKMLEQVIGALKRDRIFDRQRALPAPRDITRIVVIHPTGAAGWADIAAELGRWQQAGIIAIRTIEAPFEGERAGPRLVAAITEAVKPVVGPADLILLVRGGGARSGLEVLDDEAVARAVCLCPIPILAGTGHAVDISLVDRVAWRSVDTPSKCLPLIGSTILRSTRLASANYQAINDHAKGVLDAAEQRLAATQGQIGSGLLRVSTHLAARLDGLWSSLPIGASRTTEQIGRMTDVADRLFGDMLARIPALLSSEERRLGRSLLDGLDRARRVLVRVDAGESLVAAIGTRAQAAVERQHLALSTLQGRILRDAERLANEADAVLIRTALALDQHDLASTLKRGFAVVTDRTGRLIANRAAAMEQEVMTILFSDGGLDVVPVQQS